MAFSNDNGGFDFALLGRENVNWRIHLGHSIEST